MASQSFEIQRFLRRLTARARALVLAELAAVWLALVAASLMGAAALGARGMSAGWLQTAFWLLALGGPAVWLARRILPRFLPVRSPGQAAAWVDREAAAQLTASLRTALELEAPADPGGHSEELAAAAVAQARASVVRLRPEALVSSAPARRALMASMAALLALVTAQVTAPAWLEGGLARFFERPAGLAPLPPDPSGDGDQGPALADIKLSLTFPAYLKREPQILEASTGRVVAPAGTVVAVEARLMTDAEAADLAAGDAAPVAAILEEGGRLKGAFTVTAPGTWRFLLRRGARSEPTRAYPIEVEADAYPTVEMTGIEDGAELSLAGGLDFGFRARDDHGLTELSFGVAAGGEERRRTMASLDDVPDAYGGDGTWFPSEWGLEPGSTAEVWLEVKDNDTVGGPKVGTSRRFQILIASDKQRHDKTLAAKEEMKEHLLAALAEHLVWGAEPAQRLSPDELELRRRQGAQVMEPVLSGFRALREAAQEDALEEQAVFQALMATERGVVQAWDELEAATAVLLADINASRGLVRRATVQGAAAVDAALGHLVVGLERAVLSMESFANLQRLEDILSSGDKLRDTADALREMLASAEDPDLNALLSKVDELQADLAQMAQQLARLDQQSAAWFQNPQRETAEMKDALAEIRELMKQGKTEEAKAALEAYMQQLEEMMAQLEGMKDEEFGEVREQATRDIGQVIEGVKQLEQREARLAQDSEAVADLAEREAGVDPDQLKEAMDAAKERARRIQEGLNKARDAADASSPGFSTERQLEQAQEDARQLESALEGQDLFRALRHAEEVAAQSQWLNAEADRRGPPEAQPRRQFQEGAAQAERESAALQRELEDLAERMRQSRQAGAEQARGAADRQQEVARETGEVSQTLEEFSKDSPFVPGEWSQQLEQAAQNMRAAQDKLREDSLRGAAGDQRAAEETLRGVREQMEAAREALEQQQRGGQGQGQGSQPQLAQSPQGEQPGGQEREDWGGRHNPDGSVKILQQGTGSEDYRKELMEGMRGETPERYQRQNRAYYERLVK